VLATGNIFSRINNKMKPRGWLIILLIFLAACATEKDNAPDLLSTPEISFGVDTTTPDGRTINDPRFAAILVTNSGEISRFDDIGRMLANYQLSEEPIATAWVYDFELEIPIPAESAIYVASPNLVTPRGSGLLAVTDADRADVMATQNRGRVLIWDELPGYLTTAFETLPVSPPSTGGGLGGLLEAER
jgi:nitrous oxide reductase accessory protein NosL